VKKSPKYFLDFIKTFLAGELIETGDSGSFWPAYFVRFGRQGPRCELVGWVPLANTTRGVRWQSAAATGFGFG
jgi:hypothetical protein